MNLLELAKAKKSKLESTVTVKLTACEKDGTVVLSEVGVIIPATEIQKFENGYAFVSGSFASQVSFSEALRLNKI